MLVLPQLVDLAFQDINLTLESCCVCHLATLIAHITVYSYQETIYSFLSNFAKEQMTITSVEKTWGTDFWKQIRLSIIHFFLLFLAYTYNSYSSNIHKA